MRIDLSFSLILEISSIAALSRMIEVSSLELSIAPLFVYELLVTRNKRCIDFTQVRIEFEKSAIS